MKAMLFGDEKTEPDLDDLSLYDAALALRRGLLAHATDSYFGDSDYRKLRRRLMNDGRSRSHVPAFVQTCRDIDQFWAYIKPKWSQYAERRAEIYDEFAPLLDAVEDAQTPPIK